MSMFTITGQVMSVITQPARIDKKTGESTPPKDKVQIFGEMPTESGEIRYDLVMLNCDDRSVYDALLNQVVSIPMGVFAPGKGQVIYFIPKGAKPVVVAAAAGGVQYSNTAR